MFQSIALSIIWYDVDPSIAGYKDSFWLAGSFIGKKHKRSGW